MTLCDGTDDPIYTIFYVEILISETWSGFCLTINQGSILLYWYKGLCVYNGPSRFKVKLIILSILLLPICCLNNKLNYPKEQLNTQQEMRYSNAVLLFSQKLTQPLG